MGHAYWPLFDLRVRIGDLLLKPLTECDLEPLVEALSDDVELNPDSAVYDGQSTALARGTITHQQYWHSMGTWSVRDWRLNFGVWLDETLIGAQELEARDFRRLRTVDTSSFLNSRERGHGYGKAMRTAVLALAFDHLDAEYAITSAWTDNQSSLGVSRALGYVDNGYDRHRRGEHADDMKHLRMTRDAWRVRGPYDVRVDCVEPCLPFFGLSP